jgi:hypothetical protein
MKVDRLRTGLTPVATDRVLLGRGKKLLELYFLPYAPLWETSPDLVPRGLSWPLHTFITCPHGSVSSRVAAWVPQPSGGPLSAPGWCETEQKNVSCRQGNPGESLLDICRGAVIKVSWRKHTLIWFDLIWNNINNILPSCVCGHKWMVIVQLLSKAPVAHQRARDSTDCPIGPPYLEVQLRVPWRKNLRPITWDIIQHIQLL